MLGEALYFAGDLGCPIEYFHVGFRPRLEQEWGVSGTDAYRQAVWRHRTAPNGVLAVKLMWRDVQELARESDPDAFEVLERPPEQVPGEIYRRLAAFLTTFMPAPSYVHLFRGDRLRQAVSAMIATQTGQWRSIPGAEMERLREPDYDRDTIKRLIGYSDFCHGHWRNLIAASGAPSVSISYEELARDYQPAVGRVMAALGSNAPLPPVRMRRQASDLSEAFVARYLRECGVPA